MLNAPHTQGWQGAKGVRNIMAAEQGLIFRTVAMQALNPITLWPRIETTNCCTIVSISVAGRENPMQKEISVVQSSIEVELGESE